MSLHKLDKNLIFKLLCFFLLDKNLVDRNQSSGAYQNDPVVGVRLESEVNWIVLLPLVELIPLEHVEEFKHISFLRLVNELMVPQAEEVLAHYEETHKENQNLHCFTVEFFGHSPESKKQNEAQSPELVQIWGSLHKQGEQHYHVDVLENVETHFPQALYVEGHETRRVFVSQLLFEFVLNEYSERVTTIFS